MSAPRPRPSIDVLAALLALSLLATGARAHEPAAPVATVPLPPPEPPPRPAELISQPAAPPATMPVAVAPLPPSRPAELSADTPNAEIVAAPLPPDRPAELTEPKAVLANPEAVLSAAPLPPDRPAELTEPKAVPANPEAVLSAAPPPPARPAELSGGTPLAIIVAPHDMPLPPERPPELGTTPPVEAAPLPPARPPELTGPSIASQLLAAPEDTVCLRNLDTLGVTYKKLPPIVNGQCSVAHPLDIESLSDGIGMNSIAVTADQMVVCGVAEGLGRWAKDAQAAAEKELGDRLKGLTLGGGYHCRGQNNVGEARLSEHAFANAMDIMGFTFAKHAPITVSFLPEGSPEAKFVDAVRASACKYFRTVLGPGSNEAHANHLHFDQRQRGGGQRLCELRPVEAAAAPGSSAQAKP